MYTYGWYHLSYQYGASRSAKQGIALTKVQVSRLKQLIYKQITDAEKLTITTINTSLTADLIDAGTSDLDDMKTLLATHIARFDSAHEQACASCDTCALEQQI